MSNQDLLGGILSRYAKGFRGGSSPETERDFDTVANQLPSSDLASALTDAFRSPETPPFPDMLANIFSRSGGRQRSETLGALIATIGPQIAGEILANHGSLSGVPAEGFDARAAEQMPEGAIRDMAEEAERRDASIMDRLGEFYAQHPGAVKALGAVSLGYILNRLAQREKSQFSGL
jgi:hypothetical protein